jgi:hypothetical protein
LFVSRYFRNILLFPPFTQWLFKRILFSFHVCRFFCLISTFFISFILLWSEIWYSFNLNFVKTFFFFLPHMWYSGNGFLWAC